MSRNLRSSVLVGLGVLAVTLGCPGADGPTGPGAPAQLTAVSPVSQSGTVGTVVSASPAVRVTDAAGTPVPGVAVTFAVAAGGGTITGATANTDATGKATVGAWTLGTRIGENRVTAGVAGLGPVTFTAAATAGAPVTLTVDDGDGQVAIAGTTVAEKVVAQIEDWFGNPVPGVPVVFAVTSGRGSVTGANAMTDDDGNAEVGSWTLGDPGANTLTATAAGLGPITWTATATVAWVVVGLGDPAIATSLDGVSWTGRTSPFDGGQVNDVAWNGSLWVAVGTDGGGNGMLATSPTGVTWTARTSPIEVGLGLGWSGTTWVAVGAGAVAVATSSDGVTWTARPVSVPGRRWDVEWNGSLWVATGTSPGIATSPDGITWTGVSSPLRNGLRVAWNGALWIAVGSTDVTMLTSADGAAWTPQATPIDTLGTDVAWDGSQWVAVGWNGVQQPSVLASSPDGTTWTRRTAPVTYPRAIATSGSLWVVTGGGLATSPDGVTWTLRTSPVAVGRGVAYARPLYPPF